MSPVNGNALETLREQGRGRFTRHLTSQSLFIYLHRLIPYIYLLAGLPSILYLCFLVPPMQVPDEGRHFLRALQIAQGQVLSQVDPTTHQAGGVVPFAAYDFVRDKMHTAFLRAEDQMRTIGERMKALDISAQQEPPLSQKKFAAFPGATIYPPVLYLPQAAAIRVAQFFTDKIYLWFYSARVFNAIIAVLIVFSALQIAPSHRCLLLIPAVLPMSLFEFGSLSTDACIIALSVLFVAFCIRFLSADSKSIRIALVICLAFLTLSKPIHIVMGLLLFAPYKRLGLRRTAWFGSTAIAISGAAYIAWSLLVRKLFTMADAAVKGSNPPAQIHFVLSHPFSFGKVLLVTLKHQLLLFIFQLIGYFDAWMALPLPPWFYRVALCVAFLIVVLVTINLKKSGTVDFILANLAAFLLIFAVFLAGYVLWNPLRSSEIILIQGRYFLPALVVLVFAAPPLYRMDPLSKKLLPVLTVAILFFSAYWTTLILDHYYFSHSQVLGENIHALFTEGNGQSCPASVDYIDGRPVSIVVTGRTEINAYFRIAATNENGTILGESDPVLSGSYFPYSLLPGASHSRWRLHLWQPGRLGNGRLWLIRDKVACPFGRVPFYPFDIPDA